MKEEYAALVKKHTLPSYESLNNEFEISSIEDNEEFLLREIRRKISDRIDFFISVVEPIIQPDTHIKDLNEAKLFTKKDIDDLFETYKRLLYYHRDCTLVALTCDEKENARFITEFFKEYESIKKILVIACLKLKESWQLKTEYEEAIGYLG